jgi:hypothetical protein
MTATEQPIQLPNEINHFNQERGFNGRGCMASIFTPENLSSLQLWPMRTMWGIYGELEKKFLGPQFVVKKNELPYVSITLTPDQVNDIIQNLDVETLLSKRKDEHQAAVKLLGEAFNSAARYNCVYKGAIEEIDRQLKEPGELLLFQKDLKDFKEGYSEGDHFIILQRTDGNFILVQVDPENQEVVVLEMDKWFEEAPDEVRTMLINYYTHEARAQIAYTAAYYLELHRIINQPDIIPPILWKVASIKDEERRAKRLEELKTYVFLLDMVSRIILEYPLWFEWQRELRDVRSFKIGDESNSYSLEGVLIHLSKCGGIDPEDQEQYKALLRALKDILSLSPDKDPSIPDEDLPLLRSPYPNPTLLDELGSSVKREEAMLNFLKSKAENMVEALRTPQSPEIVQQALVSPDDLKKTFPEMNDLLNSFKQALGGKSEWDRFIMETSSSISTALILYKNDSEELLNSEELLTRIREIVEKKVAGMFISKNLQSLKSVGYVVDEEWDFIKRRFSFNDPRFTDMLCIMMLSAGITAEPGNEGKLENLQYLYQLLQSDYEEKLRRDTDELKRQRVKNDRFLEILEGMGLTLESYRNLLDPLASLFNRGGKVHSELARYLDASRIIFPLLYMAMKEIADVTAVDSLLEEVFLKYILKYSGIKNEKDIKIVREVFSKVQEIVRQTKRRQQ